MDAFRKQRAKQFVRRLVGEPYVGKRLKLERLGRKLNALRLAPDAILDAGSEDATFVYWLANRYPRAQVTAVDIDDAAIAACVAARPQRYRDRVEFQVATFAELPTGQFDLITVLDVLEHIPNDRAAVRELARALRPGGTLLVHVPRNRWRTWGGSEHVVTDGEAWRVNPGHVRMGYSPDQLRELLSDNGLDVSEIEPWLGRLGVLAHSFYSRLEEPLPLRLLTLPVTIAAARLEARRSTPDGNTVFACAVKR